MSPRARHRLRQGWDFVVDALSGRMGVLMMTLAYAVFAVVLLGYVSTQVYTNSLMEDISARKHEQRLAKERIARLTARYAALSSRARIGSYCEERLGMVQADAGNVVRLAVEGEGDAHGGVLRFTEEPADLLGSDIGGLSEVIQR